MLKKKKSATPSPANNLGWITQQSTQNKCSVDTPCRELYADHQGTKLLLLIRGTVTQNRGQLAANQPLFRIIVFWLHLVYNWNDRRLCCVFISFYSAIFKLMSAMFQTFAYNSRPVRSSYMKLGQQFEINQLYVRTKI